jgi:hypothetical protein
MRINPYSLSKMILCDDDITPVRNSLMGIKKEENSYSSQRYFNFKKDSNICQVDILPHINKCLHSKNQLQNINGYGI